MTINLEEYVVTEAQVIQPGDTLVITFTRPLAREEAERIKERLVEIAPDINIAIIDQVASMAVKRA